VNFEFEWWTKEFRSDQLKMMSVYRVVVEYYCSVAATLKVGISGDGGTNFHAEINQTLVVGAELKRAFFDFICTYNTVIVRLQCNDGGRFQIVKVYIQSIESGEILE